MKNRVETLNCDPKIAKKKYLVLNSGRFWAFSQIRDKIPNFGAAERYRTLLEAAEGVHSTQDWEGHHLGDVEGDGHLLVVPHGKIHLLEAVVSFIQQKISKTQITIFTIFYCAEHKFTFYCFILL